MHPDAFDVARKNPCGGVRGGCQIRPQPPHAGRTAKKHMPRCMEWKPNVLIGGRMLERRGRVEEAVAFRQVLGPKSEPQIPASKGSSGIWHRHGA